MGAVIGIDLGTTNTVVATARDERPTAIPDESGSTLIPSIVSFLPSGAVLVGSAARERRSVDPRNTIYSIKRLIGRTWGTAEVNEAVARFPFELREGPGRATFVVARGETYTLPEISAFVLRKAKSIAELELGEPVDRAVITVPANFNDLQRAATKVASRVAGLEILRVLNEPTAAALAFGHASGNRECIAIYDFGGGTFDFTLLRLSDDVFEVLATGGDTYLGGDDIDSAIVQRISGRLRRNSGIDPKAEAETFERLRGAAEQLKIDLSSANDARIRLSDYELADATGIEFSLTRAELDILAQPILERTFTVCRDVLASANVSPREITHVLLVGGPTRDPYVRHRVQEFFGKRPQSDVDPHEVVALGAARHAMALTQLRATASGMPLPPSPATLQLAQQHLERWNQNEQPERAESQLGETSSEFGGQSTMSPAPVSIPLPEREKAVPAPTTQRFGDHYRASVGSESEATPLIEDLPARHEQPGATLVAGAKSAVSFGAGEPRAFGDRGVPTLTTTPQLDATEPEEAAVPALAPRGPGRDSTARTRRMARAQRDTSSAIASALVHPRAAARVVGKAPAEAQRVSAESRELAGEVERSSADVPALDVARADSLQGTGDSSKNLPAVKPPSTIALGKGFASPVDVRDDLWDSPVQGPSSNALPALTGSNAQQRTGWADSSSDLNQPAPPASSDWTPDLPIVAGVQSHRSRATSPDLSSAAPATPGRATESPADNQLASSLDAATAQEKSAHGEIDLAENEPTVVRRSAREAASPHPHWGSPPEPKLDAIDLPIVGGSGRVDAENRLSEAEIRARYGNLPLIVGGKRVGTRDSPSKAYTPPLGTRTQVTADSTPDARNLPPPVAMPELDLPIPSVGGAGRAADPIGEPAMSPTAPAQRAGTGTATRAKLGSAQTLAGGVEDSGGLRRPASPPLTEKSTPLVRPPQPPQPLALESHEYEATPLDDFVDPLTNEPTRPRFSVDVALTSAVRDESPKSHRPSSRPSARQNIDELELPIPNLPQRQSAPGIGGPTEDVLSPPSGPLNPEKARLSAESALSSRQPEPGVRSSVLGGAQEPGRLLGASSAGRSTIPFGQPLAAPLTPSQLANPFSVNAAGQGAAAASAPDLEVPPLIPPLPRAYSTSARPVLLIDVTPLSLCVETVGGYVDVIVNRNTSVPCERTREYVTAQDNQQTVNIRVAQGESRLFTENVLLGEIQLSGIAVGVRGQSRIAVTFGLDADGLLHVRAIDVTSGKSAVADLRLAGVSGAHEQAQPSARQAAKGLT